MKTPLHVLAFATAIAAALGAPLAHAGGMQALERFLESTRAAEAAFVQTVTTPARQGQAAREKTSSGHFAFQRPGRFRFDYEKPFAQTIVADGQTLWLHDPDLNQVTARAQQQALQDSPAVLFASAGSLQALQKDFELAEEPDSGGLQWVQATARASDGPIQSIRIGFRPPKGELGELQVTDRFGQHSRLVFEQLQRLPSLPAARFEFTPPEGAEINRQ